MHILVVSAPRQQTINSSVGLHKRAYHLEPQCSTQHPVHSRVGTTAVSAHHTTNAATTHSKPSGTKDQHRSDSLADGSFCLPSSMNVPSGIAVSPPSCTSPRYISTVAARFSSLVAGCVGSSNQSQCAATNKTANFHISKWPTVQAVSKTTLSCSPRPNDEIKACDS